jgi:hypothetical protein
MCTHVVQVGVGLFKEQKLIQHKVCILVYVIRLRAQNILTIMGSIVKMIWEWGGGIGTLHWIFK